MALVFLPSTLEQELELSSKKEDSQSSTKNNWRTVKEKCKFILNLKTAKYSTNGNTLNKKPFLAIMLWLKLKRPIHSEICTLTRQPETSTLTWRQLQKELSLRLNKSLSQVKLTLNWSILPLSMLIRSSSQIQTVHGLKSELRKEQSLKKMHKARLILPYKED